MIQADIETLSPMGHVILMLAPLVASGAVVPGTFLSALRAWALEEDQMRLLCLLEMRTLVFSPQLTRNGAIKTLLPFLSMFVDGTMQALSNSSHTAIEAVLAELVEALHQELATARSCRSALSFVSAVLRDMGLDTEALVQSPDASRVGAWEPRPVWTDLVAKEKQKTLTAAKKAFLKTSKTQQANALYSIEKLVL